VTARGAAARRKGHTFERAVAKYLGVRTTRNTRPGTHEDAGDIVLPGWCAEIRSRANWSVALWFDVIESKAEADQFPLLILHRMGRGTKDALVVMRLSEFAALTTEVPR
jgi:hypothetical protein